MFAKLETLACSGVSLCSQVTLMNTGESSSLPASSSSPSAVVVSASASAASSVFLISTCFAIDEKTPPSGDPHFFGTAPELDMSKSSGERACAVVPQTYMYVHMSIHPYLILANKSQLALRQGTCPRSYVIAHNDIIHQWVRLSAILAINNAQI